jgi:opacity protein-like surface antigen
MNLKKIIFICFLVNSLSFNSQLLKGDILVDPYVGIPNYPNLGVSKMFSINTQGSDSYKLVGGFFSYGFRLEYMLTDKLGLGTDFNYVKSGYTSDYIGYQYDEFNNQLFDTNGIALLMPYSEKYTAERYRAMGRLNYYFSSNEKVNFYGGLGIGYYGVNRSFTTTPYDPSSASFINFVDEVLFPISFRLAIGAKFYFTRNFGGHVELGSFGGGTIQFGVSAKF